VLNNKKLILTLFKVIGAVLVASALYVYINQLVLNWNKISTGQIQFNYFWGSIAILFVCLAYIWFTLAWQCALNSFKETRIKINFFQCLGIYNSTQLAKYIPGKVWGYVLQAGVLKKFGINKSTTIYLNILLSLLYVLYSLVLGLFFFLYYLGIGTLSSLLILLALLSLILLYFHFNASDGLSKYLEKLSVIFKKEIRIYKIDKASFVQINIIMFLSVVFFGLSGFASAMAIGTQFDGGMILPISSAMVFADAIGFLVLIAPGGIGVREVILFAMLDVLGVGITAVFIPVVARLANMFADLLLGSVGFISLYHQHYRTSAKKDRGSI
jgi:glycosyltransferase 2 family protein